MLGEIKFIPDQKSIQVRPGTTILDAAGRAKVHIRTRCDGKAACLMCKVKVADQSGLSAPNLNEKLKLGGLEQQGVRLACQARVMGTAVVEVPEDPLKAAVRKQLEKSNGDSLWD